MLIMPVTFDANNTSINEEYYIPESDIFSENDKQSMLDKLSQIMNEASMYIPPTKRHSKIIDSPSEIDEVMHITHEQARSKSTIMDFFADFEEGPHTNPHDIVTVPAGAFGGLSNSDNPDSVAESTAQIPDPMNPGRYLQIKTSVKKNIRPFVTTVGIWFFNRIFTEPISDIVGYVNEPITKSVYNGINKKIAHAVLEDRMGINQIKNFIADTQIIMSCCSALAPSHSEQMFTMEEELSKYKKELLSKPGVKEALDKGDLVLMKQIEKELIDFSTKKLLDGDPAMDMFNSGAKADLNNNFKNMYIMRSGVTGTNKQTTIVTTSYMEGMDPKDYSVIADGAVCGSFGRSCQTAGPGHIERQFLGATSHIKLLGPNTDCHTPYYINVNLTNKNADDWFYSYIIGDDGKLIEFLPSLKNQFVGKTVKFRFSSMCKAPAGYICEACMGTLVRRLGLGHAAGLLSPIAMSALKNGQMKKFHVADIKLAELDLSDF